MSENQMRFSKMDTVSIIIPTWNRAKNLKKVINSALNQTYSPLEILVCDDGSDDDSREIVKSFNNPTIRWIEGEHSGLPSVPRNRGIRESKGEWLAFLDSDDEWLPEKLETQFEFIKKNKCDAVCSNAFRSIVADGTTDIFFDKINPKKIISFQKLIQINYIICSSVLIKKSIVLKCGGFCEEKELRALEDYELWLRASTFTFFGFIREPLLIYRDAPDLSVRKESMDVKKQRITVLKYFLKWVKDSKSGIEFIRYEFYARIFLFLELIKIKIT